LKRNKAALSLLWDLDARPHEISGLKIKHVKLKQKYGEGEIPFESKTGTGPILLTFSFPYVRDWINEHPFKNEPNASIICNQITGAPVHADTLNNIMKHAEASKVDVNFQYTNQTFCLEITDNGKGIGDMNGRDLGNGLMNMKKRMDTVNGRFEIISEKGTGTRITLKGKI